MSGRTVRLGLRICALSTVAAISPTLLTACAQPHPAASTAIVVAHDKNEMEPLLSAADLMRLHSAGVDPHTTGSIAFVVAAGLPGIATVDLTPRRPNGQIEHGPRADALVDAQIGVLQQTIHQAARQSDSTDLLRALDTAARAGASRLIVLTAGLSTIDPLDLRLIGWNADPYAVAGDLAGRRLLPNLHGIAVEFSGLARTSGAQPDLGPREQQWLRDLWLAICAGAGGTCTVDDTVRPARPSVSALTAPPVPVPRVMTTPGPGETEVVTVPSDLLFRPDSCAVLDPSTVHDALTPLINALATGRYTVAISGRTAPVGDTGIPLSTCRAHVAAALLAVPPSVITAVRGDGSLLDPPGAGLGDNGLPDPSKLAALRRVVFTLTPRELTR